METCKSFFNLFLPDVVLPKCGAQTQVFLLLQTLRLAN
ncbi:hypothetical protein HBZS_109150 [Helicobacter bizzozeronii CCUG 35545]|nr:hypothetical protein HBZS_109150 [Helicobacter bizzozeronii CCUG 35545]